MAFSRSLLQVEGMGAQEVLGLLAPSPMVQPPISPLPMALPSHGEGAFVQR
jgi:hypothetical protein